MPKAYSNPVPDIYVSKPPPGRESLDDISVLRHSLRGGQAPCQDQPLPSTLWEVSTKPRARGHQQGPPGRPCEVGEVPAVDQRWGRPLLSCPHHHQHRHPCALPGTGLHSAPRPSPSSCVQGPALAFHRGCSGTRPTGRHHGHHGGSPGLVGAALLL